MNQLSSFDKTGAHEQSLFGRPGSAADLMAMIQELTRAARRLQERELEWRPSVNCQSETDEQIAMKVRRLLVDRERRKTIFSADLFADPAWDILLNLYASHLEQQRETITGIICLAGVPATTGLRWVHRLAEEDLLILREDPLDQRRKWVLLSPSCLAALTAYFTPQPTQPCSA